MNFEYTHWEIVWNIFCIVTSPVVTDQCIVISLEGASLIVYI